MPAWAAQPEPVEARRRSCTGWTSTSVPPRTIRVGRAGGSGGVETVNFQRYVAVVMAKEWPTYLPTAALEAAAVAVKQYAWYHAMAGHHRSSYRTAGGSCYDVVDSTRDQLYKPEQVRVSGKIRAAVGATWGLSLRKGGRFFMTGYRSGSSRRCGADADGWKLFARSVIACAKRGLSRQEIQAIYYGGNLRFVWAGGGQASAPAPGSAAASPPRGGDSTPPRGRDSSPPARPEPPAPPPPPPPDPPDAPTVNLRAATSTDVAVGQGAEYALSWAGSSDRLRYQVQQLVEGEWAAVSLPGRSATELPEVSDFDPGVEDDRRYRVRAIDRDGLRSPWTYSPSLSSRAFAEVAGGANWMGHWQWRAEPATRSDGFLSYSTDEDGGVTLVVEGRSISLVGSAGPDGGRLRVLVDGTDTGVVDLADPVEQTETPIFTHEWESTGAHVIRLEPVSGRVPATMVEGIVVYR